MVRPERLQLLTGAVPDDLNALRGTVQEVVYQGESFLLQVLLADGSRIAARGVSSAGAMAVLPDAGAAVTLGLGIEDTILLVEDPALP